MKPTMMLLWMVRVILTIAGVLIYIVGIATFIFGIPLLILGIIPGIITMIFGFAIMFVGVLLIHLAGIPTISEKINFDAIKRIKDEAQQKKDDEHEVAVQEEIDRLKKEDVSGL